MSTPDVINVKSSPYNAVGDGVADDAAAITAAMVEAFGPYTAPKGIGLQKGVYFPTGTYKCNSVIDYCCVGVSIFGDGPTLSTIKWGGSTGGGVQHPLFRSRGDGGMRYTVVRDLGFDCVSGGSTDLTIGIDWDCDPAGATNVVFDNVKFKNCTTGVYCGRGQFGNGQSDTGQWFNCTFVDCYDGIQTGNFNALESVISGCTFTNMGNHAGRFDAGFLLYAGDSTFAGAGFADFEFGGGDAIAFENCTSSSNGFAITNGGASYLGNVDHTGTQSIAGGVAPYVTVDGCTNPNGEIGGLSGASFVIRDTTFGNASAIVGSATYSLWDVPQCTFAQLPPTSPNPYAAKVGQEAIITNCNTTTWGATAAGGGANTVRVRYNGSVWTVMIDETDTLMPDESTPTPEPTPVVPPRKEKPPRGQGHHPHGWHFVR